MLYSLEFLGKWCKMLCYQTCGKEESEMPCGRVFLKGHKKAYLNPVLCVTPEFLVQRQKSEKGENVVNNKCL